MTAATADIIITIKVTEAAPPYGRVTAPPAAVTAAMAATEAMVASPPTTDTITQAIKATAI